MIVEIKKDNEEFKPFNKDIQLIKVSLWKEGITSL